MSYNTNKGGNSKSESINKHNSIIFVEKNMLPVIQQIAYEFKAELRKIYGDELAYLILFGSHARGDFHQDSDIDFAVVLKNPTTTSTSEIFKISDISQNISLKYNQFVTYIGMPEQKFKNSTFGLYQEIRKDGITI